MKAWVTWPEHLKGSKVLIVNSPAVDIYNVTFVESGESAVFHGDNLSFAPRVQAMTTPTIGDFSRDGLLQIVDTSPQSDTCLRVTVREMIGGADGWVGGLPVGRMRRLAKTAYRGATGSHLVRRFHASGCDYVTFAVTGPSTDWSTYNA